MFYLIIGPSFSLSRVIFFAGLLTSGVTFGASYYPVRIASPTQVGERLKITVKATYKFSEDWNNSTIPPFKTEFNADLVGTEEIVALTPNGRPAKVTVAVEKCSKDGNELIKAGAIIGALYADGRVLFTVDNSIPSEDTRRVLGELISVAAPGEPSPDDEVGTRKAVKVGESWPINTDLLAKATRLPYPIRCEDIHGMGTLKDVIESNGVPFETIVVTETCMFDSRKGTNGKTYEDLNMNFVMSKTIPTRFSPEPTRTEENRIVTFKVIGPHGSAMVREERADQYTAASAFERKQLR